MNFKGNINVLKKEFDSIIEQLYSHSRLYMVIINISDINNFSLTGQLVNSFFLENKLTKKQVYVLNKHLDFGLPYMRNLAIDFH